MFSTIKRDGDWRPNQVQLLLLKASLLSGEDAVKAWQQWSSLANVESLDTASDRLLPLLSDNLYRLGISHQRIAGKLRGFRLWTYYTNRLKLRDAIDIVGSLSEAGIRTVVLKGIALNELFYRDYSLRPMNDIDLLVAPEAAPAAIALFDRLGWRCGDFEIKRHLPLPNGEALTLDSVPPSIRRRILIHHDADFANHADTQIDLHWHVLQARWSPADDQEFWDSTTPLQIGGVSTLALDATTSLVYVLAHGARWCRPPSIRWIADAMFIIRSKQSAGIGWSRRRGDLQLTFPGR